MSRLVKLLTNTGLVEECSSYRGLAMRQSTSQQRSSFHQYAVQHDDSMLEGSEVYLSDDDLLDDDGAAHYNPNGKPVVCAPPSPVVSALAGSQDSNQTHLTTVSSISAMGGQGQSPLLGSRSFLNMFPSRGSVSGAGQGLPGGTGRARAGSGGPSIGNGPSIN